MLTSDEQLIFEMLADPVGCTRSLRRTHDAVLRGRRPTSRIRGVISDSWQRSMAAKVNPDAKSVPVKYGSDDVAARLDAHALAASIPTLQETLVEISESARHAVFITDAHGIVLWSDGAPAIRRLAERVSLVEGATCAEDLVGTTAIGISLSIDGPAQIHSAEHMMRVFHGWTCTASPVHDPDTGEVLGVIATGAPVAAAHPSSAMLVTTTAKLVEHQMRVLMIQRDVALRSANESYLRGLRGAGGALLSPTGKVLAFDGTDPLPARIPIATGRVLLGDGREGIIEPLPEGFLLRLARHTSHSLEPSLSLTLLGSGPPAAVIDGRRIPLTERHAEILSLLALYPDGLTSDQLTYHVYGDAGTLATTRAEIHRLRAQLGPVVSTRPYRLRANVTADLLTVKTALRGRDIHRALASYHGSLLPRSESPTIRAEREELHSAIRRVALDHGGGDELWLLAETDLGRHDLELLDAAQRALDPDDPRRAMIASRANRVLTDD